MKIFLIIIFFILVLLFIPIPFKLKFYFSKDNIYIKFYKFTIFKKSFNEVLTKSNHEDTKDKATKIKKKAKKKYKVRPLSNKGKIKFITLMKENKFKPKLYVRGFFNYSLEDAAFTAISFGMINTYAPILTWALSIVFNIKKLNIPITPTFKNCFFFHSEINCIFTISIAKTIFIAVLLINNYIKVKGDELEREEIWV